MRAVAGAVPVRRKLPLRIGHVCRARDGGQVERAESHAVETVDNGRAAIAAVRAAAFDAVLMDIQMSDMDGIQATQHIRALPPPLGTVPIIALTANALAGARDEYLAAGMNGYVSKPFRPAALLATRGGARRGGRTSRGDGARGGRAALRSDTARGNPQHDRQGELRRDGR